MNLFAMMETSGGAMQAERMRAEVVAANMANAETTRTPTGGAYRRQHVVFAANPGDPEFANSLNAAAGDGAFGASGAETPAAGGFAALPAPLLPFNLNGAKPAAPGVHIAGVVQDTSPPLKRYDPGQSRCGGGRICLLSGH